MLKQIVTAMLGMSALCMTLDIRAAGKPAIATANAKPHACRIARDSAACRYGIGLLWKVERTGQTPSHLFGTIHLADPRVTTLAPPVKTVFDQSERFAMELILDGAAFIDMAEVMFFSDDHTLDAVLGAQRFAELKKLFGERGLPVADLNRKKPWAAMMQLSSTPARGVALDFQLQLDATLQNKKISGLETIEEQLAVFDGLVLADQVALLDAALRQQTASPELIETMVQAYLSRDLGRIQTVIDTDRGANPRLHDTVMTRLLAERNQRMLARLRPHLEAGNAFVAVGAAHLPGERGLLALLDRAGWRVTPVH